MSTEATVLIPTHNHGETLRYAVGSVLAQTMQDFEILIVGDGVPEVTRELAAELARNDARVRFFDFPKGPRHGELLRHAALAEARGRNVVYLCDDDLWMPSHLAHTIDRLSEADLANGSEVLIHPDGEGRLVTFDLNHPQDRRMLMESRSGFGLSSGAHTLEAYRRLPHGWRTTPREIHTDTYMWQQFLEQPWCRTASSARPTILRFEAQSWDGQPREQRLAALDLWLGRITAPGGESDLAWRIFEAAWGASAHPGETRRNARIGAGPDFAEYELGQKVSLEGAGAGLRYLSWGWAAAEPWGVWSDGEEARLTLSFREPPQGRLVLDASFHAFRGWRHPWLNIGVAANGRELCEWRVLGPGEQTRQVELPAARRLDLRFLIPGVRPARQVKSIADPRRLGIGLRSFHIRQAP